MLDNELPRTIFLSIRGKNVSGKQSNLDAVAIAKDGIRFNRWLLAPSTTGTWQYFDWTPTQTSNCTIQVTIITEQGDTWQQHVPLEDYVFKQATDLQFISIVGPMAKVISIMSSSRQTPSGNRKKHLLDMLVPDNVATASPGNEEIEIPISIKVKKSGMR